MTIPIIQNALDLSGHAGNSVKVIGVYGIQDLGGYALKVKTVEGRWKRVTKIAFIRLKDGSFINLGNRPAEEMKALYGHRVTATGKLLIPAEPPVRLDMAKPDPGPTLIEITLIQPQPEDDHV